MCGFAAFLTGSAARDERLRVVQSMLARIEHRGPDDHGIIEDPLAVLGFRRLSILDLSPLGHQPMSSVCGRYSIVFNGEIYNYLELRRELVALGHEFNSRTDTEVLLHAYIQWGRDCLPRFNGMWAFVLIDRVRQVVFGSRDRLGIKPLYRCATERGQLLASEIKAIRASGLYTSRLNLVRSADYLADGRLDDTDETLFEGIEQIPAAHAFELDISGRYSQWCYWDPYDYPERSQPDVVERFATLFEDAIALHMRSDVPVAVHLSGGLDSSSIACATARVRQAAGAPGPLMAFSYCDPEFDETPHINATLAQSGATSVMLRTDARRVWNDLPQVIAAQDEPTQSLTPVVGWQLMRLTAEHGVRVVLNGQGADETLGGYHNYFRDGWVTELLTRGPFSAWREVARFAQAKGLIAQSLFIDMFKRALQANLRRSGLYRHLSLHRYRSQHPAREWLQPTLTQRLTGIPDAPGRGLRHSLIHSIRREMLPLYLRVEDRNSMAHSVEARVPFLDHRLVEMALTLQRKWKLDADLNKVVLRRAMEGRIPEVVNIRREKMGFPTPNVRWLKTELRNDVMDVFSNLPAEARDHLKPSSLKRMLQQHTEEERECSIPLLRAAQWVLWHQVVLKS